MVIFRAPNRPSSGAQGRLLARHAAHFPRAFFPKNGAAGSVEQDLRETWIFTFAACTPLRDRRVLRSRPAGCARFFSAPPPWTMPPRCTTSEFLVRRARMSFSARVDSGERRQQADHAHRRRSQRLSAAGFPRRRSDISTVHSRSAPSMSVIPASFTRSSFCRCLHRKTRTPFFGCRARACSSSKPIAAGWSSSAGRLSGLDRRQNIDRPACTIETRRT